MAQMGGARTLAPYLACVIAGRVLERSTDQAAAEQAITAIVEGREVYALAQGPVAIGGFVAQGQAASVTRGVPTAGRISNGAIVEREVGFSLAAQTQLRLSLHNPDLTTATRIAAAINAYLVEHNANPKPFVWTRSADAILAKLDRCPVPSV